MVEMVIWQLPWSRIPWHFPKHVSHQQHNNTCSNLDIAKTICTGIMIPLMFDSDRSCNCHQTEWLLAAIIIIQLAWFYPVFGSQQMILRIMYISDPPNNEHVSFWEWLERTWQSKFWCIWHHLSGWRMQKCQRFWLSLVQLGSCQQLVCLREPRPFWLLPVFEMIIHRFVFPDGLRSCHWVGWLWGLHSMQYPWPAMSLTLPLETLESFEPCCWSSLLWLDACWMPPLIWLFHFLGY